MSKKRIIKITEDNLRSIIIEKIQKILGVTDNMISQDVFEIFKLHNVSPEEFNEQYVDLIGEITLSGYGGNFMGTQGGGILCVESTTTLSVEDTKAQIQKKFRLKDWQFATSKGANGIELFVLIPSIFKNTRLIQKAMYACGWSLGTKELTRINNRRWWKMSFDPMFQENVISEIKKYTFLFHWTPQYNVESILKNGLQPRSENSAYQYPNRVHLLKPNITQYEALNIGQQLCSMNDNSKNNGEYVLLGISTKRLSDDMEIYYDPRYDGGYYTKTSIPPDAIQVLDTHTFYKTKTDK